MALYGLDIETKEVGKERVLSTVQFYNPEEGGIFLDMKVEEDRERAKKAIQNPDNTFVAFEAQTELFFLTRDLEAQPKIVGDGYIAALLLQEKETSLDALSKKYLKKGKKGDLKELADGSFSFDKEVFTDEDKEYAIQDAVLAYELEAVLKERIDFPVIYKMEIALLPFLVQSRRVGLRVDLDRLRKSMDNLQDKFQQTMQELWEEVGFEFDINTRRVAPILEAAKVEAPVVYTKTGSRSYSAEVLNQITDSPFITKFLEARHLSSVLSSQKDIYENIDSAGVLHPEFRPINYSGSARIYSTRPSANQMPVEIRQAVIPREGKKFWYLDWSAAEIMYLAYMAGEKELVEYYEKGGDIHKYIYSRMVGITPEEVTDEDRKISKVVTFSIIYGSGGHAASRVAGVSIGRAMEWVQIFFDSFPKINNYMKGVVEKAEKVGVVYTWMGRRRVLRNLFSLDKQVKEEGKRQAANTPIQNGVADLLKWSMIRIGKRLPSLQILFVVFDSFLIEVDEAIKVEDYQKQLEEIFTFEKDGQKVKFRFDIKEGASWGDLQLMK